MHLRFVVSMLFALMTISSSALADEVHKDVSEVGSFSVWDDANPLKNRFPTHLESERHYDSCLLYAYQLWLEYGRQNELLNACLDANPELDPTCSPIQRNELYKPVSETHGSPALLLAGSLNGQSLSVEDSQGNRVGSIIRTSCCNNGGRAHWFIREKCETLPSPTILRLSGGTCRVIEDPCRRYQ